MRHQRRDIELPIGKDRFSVEKNRLLQCCKIVTIKKRAITGAPCKGRRIEAITYLIYGDLSTLTAENRKKGPWKGMMADVQKQTPPAACFGNI